IQRWSEVPAGSPLFETLYVFENYPEAGDAGSGGLRIGNLRSFESTNYPLTLIITAAERISLQLSYDRARVDEGAAPRLLQHLATLLAGMAEAVPAAELPLLAPAELHQLRCEWNETLPSATVPLLESFESWVDRTPDATALLASGASLS